MGRECHCEYDHTPVTWALSEEILPILQSFTFYGIAIPEPTTIGPQPDTAGRNLTSAIIGTYKLYHLPDISNYSDTFRDTNDCPTTKLSMFISALRNMICTQRRQIITAQHLLKSKFEAGIYSMARFLKNDLLSGKEVIS